MREYLPLTPGSAVPINSETTFKLVSEILDHRAELEAWRTRFPGYRYKDGDIAIQEVVSE